MMCFCEKKKRAACIVCIPVSLSPLQLSDFLLHFTYLKKQRHIDSRPGAIICHFPKSFKGEEDYQKILTEENNNNKIYLEFQSTFMVIFVLFRICMKILCSKKK